MDIIIGSKPKCRLMEYKFYANGFFRRPRLKLYTLYAVHMKFTRFYTLQAETPEATTPSETSTITAEPLSTS